MKLEETTCEGCEAHVIHVDSEEGRLVLDWYASEAGNIIVRGDRAAVLKDAATAKKLLERGGVDADRFLLHHCSAGRSGKRKKKPPSKSRARREF